MEFFRLKALAEQRLASSGIPYAIVRPTHLMDTWATVLGKPLVKQGRTMVFGSGTNPISFVAGSDVAQVLAALAKADGDGFTTDLGGPEALTIDEVNTLVQRVLRIRAKRRTVISRGMLRAGSAVLRPFAGLLSRQMAMSLLLDTQPQVVSSTAVWTRFGITPLTFSAWLERHADLITAPTTGGKTDASSAG